MYIENQWIYHIQGLWLQLGEALQLESASRIGRAIHSHRWVTYIYTLTQVAHNLLWTYPHYFSPPSLSLCQTMDPLPPNFLSSPSGRVLLSLLCSNRSRFAQRTEENMFNLFFFQAATGVSGILRWRIGTSDTILSLMVSVPYRYLCMAMAICGNGNGNRNGNGNAVNKIYFQPAPLFFLGCCGTHQRQPGSRLLCHVLRNSRQVAKMFNIHNKLLYIWMGWKDSASLRIFDTRRLLSWTPEMAA